MSPVRNRVRIIGGQWRSRIIIFPDDCSDLRPTPDRVRETVFNWLGQDLTGKLCLDLFAGSGVMGLEAASRGASHVVMVERDVKIAKALQDNVRKLGAANLELVVTEALHFLETNQEHFDVIFLDPPYRLGMLPGLLSLLPRHLTREGQVYLESEESLQFVLESEWKIRRSGRAGKVNYGVLVRNENR